MYKDDIIKQAIQTFNAGERIDMSSLARQLGIGRATLYRAIGDRNQLLLEVMWALNQKLYSRIVSTAPEAGPERIQHIVCGMIDGIARNQPFRHFLQHEGLAALELVTSPEGLRGRILARTVNLIEQEHRAGNYNPPASAETLADAAVALSEYFLYAQFVVQGFKPQTEQAKRALLLLFREDSAATYAKEPWTAH